MNESLVWQEKGYRRRKLARTAKITCVRPGIENREKYKRTKRILERPERRTFPGTSPSNPFKSVSAARSFRSAETRRVEGQVERFVSLGNIGLLAGPTVNIFLSPALSSLLIYYGISRSLFAPAALPATRRPQPARLARRIPKSDPLKFFPKLFPPMRMPPARAASPSSGLGSPRDREEYSTPGCAPEFIRGDRNVPRNWTLNRFPAKSSHLG